MKCYLARWRRGLLVPFLLFGSFATVLFSEDWIVVVSEEGHWNVVLRGDSTCMCIAKKCGGCDSWQISVSYRLYFDAAQLAGTLKLSLKSREIYGLYVSSCRSWCHHYFWLSSEAVALAFSMFLENCIPDAVRWSLVVSLRFSITFVTCPNFMPEGSWIVLNDDGFVTHRRQPGQADKEWAQDHDITIYETKMYSRTRNLMYHYLIRDLSRSGDQCCTAVWARNSVLNWDPCPSLMMCLLSEDRSPGGSNLPIPDYWLWCSSMYSTGKYSTDLLCKNTLSNTGCRKMC